MNIPAKINLSELESTLISNPEWILVKNQILQKVTRLFAELAELYLSNPTNSNLPEEIISIPPKISKGDQYKGLPYLVLDFPRFFDKKHVFAIRTFFWWGNYFSATIHLKGRYRELYAEKILNMMSGNQKTEWMINISEEEWIHDLAETEHWIKFSAFDRDKVKNSDLFKISASTPILQWDEAGSFLSEIHALYMGAI